MPDASASTPPLLVPLIERFGELGRALFDDGIWQCDSGAVTLAFLCDRLGIDHQLHVGLYYWPEERQAIHWEHVAGGTPTAEELASFWHDEHHHWITIIDERLEEPWLLDPNGEVRGEQRAMPLSSAGDRYRSKPALGEYSGIYPDTEPGEVAEWDPIVARAIAMIEKEGANPRRPLSPTPMLPP